jgi:outer membrane receptor protein involved in Fe transport
MNKIAILQSALCVVAAGTAVAQTGSITGLVEDPAKAAIQHASVSVTNKETGIIRHATTNSQGFYTVPLLSQGTYSVEADAAGFQTLIRDAVRLDEGQALRVDFPLAIGATAQSLRVTGDSPALETEGSSQSTVVGTKAIIDLPLNGRNPLAFATLVPGVRTISNFGTLSTSAYSDGRIAISGGTPNGNNVMIDGAAAENYTSGGPQLVLSPDATEEFRIITHNPSAEYGRTGGGVLSFVSKSGSNQFHGDLWEFVRNKSFNANDFVSNRTGQAIAPFTFNQFGATAGGPLVRNRTFFFANWESARQRTGSRSLFTVPTNLQRQGDFSQTLDANGRLLAVYDPTSSKPNPAISGHDIRTPFSGNVIPPSRLNPVALAIGQYYPQPNQAGNLYTAANNYQGYGSSQENKDLLGLKIDHYFTPSRRLSGRYTWDDTKLVNPAFFGGSIADPSGAPAAYPRNSAVATYSDALQPNLLFEAHAGLNRFGIARIDRSYGFDVTKIGMPAAINQELEFQEFPYVSMSDVSPIGQNQGDASGQRDNSWTVGGTMTWIKGAHNIKYGAELRIYQWNSVQGTGQFSFTFSRNFTNGPDPNAAATSGYGYASFLLGNPASGVIYRYPYPEYETKNFGSFVQDDWKISRTLTLNLGLRWEHEGPATDRHNAISNFDPTAQTTANGIPLTGAIVFPGVGGLSRGNREASWTDFEPRAGLAWQFLPKTVFRAAYGIYYLPSTGDYILLGSTGFASQTAYVYSNDGGLTPAGSLSDPFPSGIVLPSGSSLGALTGLGTNVTGNLRSLTNGYSQQWSANVQRELPGSWLLEAGYIGSRGVHLPADNNLDALPASALTPGSGLQTLVNNPYAPLVSIGALSNPQVTRASLLTPFPQFTGVTALDSWAGSTYHAATVRLDRRFADGFSLLLSYTYSKLLDNNEGGGETQFSDSGANTVQNWNNWNAEKALSTSDQPQRLVVSGSYLLPFGKSGHRFYRAAVGGWQVNAIASALSGNVIAVTANAPAYGGSRPNVIGDPSVSNPTVNHWLNPAAFTNIPAYTYGNGPRNLPRTLTQPLYNLDTSLFREARIGERFTLEFRAEAFNVANHPTFGTPGGNINSATFGQISSVRTGTAPRQLQFGLKLYY